jgi:hypothetical protein
VANWFLCRSVAQVHASTSLALSAAVENTQLARDCLRGERMVGDDDGGDGCTRFAAIARWPGVEDRR